MIPYPRIDPVIIKIGPLALRWYGLMYLLGFLASLLLVKMQIREECPNAADVKDQERVLEGLLMALIAGVILGGRLGYVLFYNLAYFEAHPAEILATWHGGMSFHGGAIGALAAGYIYCRRHSTDFFKWADRFCITAPIGLGLGRIGNFINGELYGRPSDLPWAMIFPQDGFVPRHPSQLYEAVLEGPFLFALLWPLRHRPWPEGRKAALFFAYYGVIRFIVEFYREPDPQCGFIAFGWMTMGQVLSIFVIVLAVLFWVYRDSQKQEV